MHFGEHLTVDGYFGETKLLDSEDAVLDCLNTLTSKLGMKQLAPPVVYHAPANDKKDPGGWSGFVVIAESHISIHTFPARRFLTADVYTCKNGMDQEYVIEYLKNFFKLGDIEINFIKRGTHYPLQNIA